MELMAVSQIPKMKWWQENTKVKDNQTPVRRREGPGPKHQAFNVRLGTCPSAGVSVFSIARITRKC